MTEVMTGMSSQPSINPEEVVKRMQGELQGAEREAASHANRLEELRPLINSLQAALETYQAAASNVKSMTEVPGRHF
jgi:hypothetical protein